MMPSAIKHRYPTLREHFVFRGQMERAPRLVLPFHQRIFERITAWLLGKLPNGRRHLAVCIPPGHGKTFIAHDTVAWSLGLFPDAQWIYASYSAQLAVAQTMRIREIMLSDWYRRVYPWAGIRDGRNTQKYFETAPGGHVYGAGLDGSLTGFRAGKKRPGFGGGIVVDDPLKPLEARSETARNGANRWFTETLLSRRNTDDTPILVIMQRLHPEDLVGHVLKVMPGEWELLSVPALQEQGGESGGQTIWPQTFSLKTARLLREVDPLTFHAQYQQEPQIPGGNIIRREWWKYYRPESLKSGNLPGMVFITADTAFKAKSTADASVLRAWLGTEEHLYCLDADYGRWNFPELLARARAFWAKWRERGCRYFIVEDKASGTPLEQTLAQGGVPAVAWKPSDYGYPEDKVGRVQKSSWFIHGGLVLLPEDGTDEAHSAALVDEAAAFSPDMSHAHDDHVDALTMAVSWWSWYGGGAAANI